MGEGGGKGVPARDGNARQERVWREAESGGGGGRTRSGSAGERSRSARHSARLWLDGREAARPRWLDAPAAPHGTGTGTRRLIEAGEAAPAQLRSAHCVASTVARTRGGVAALAGPVWSYWESRIGACRHDKVGTDFLQHTTKRVGWRYRRRRGTRFRCHSIAISMCCTVHTLYVPLRGAYSCISGGDGRASPVKGRPARCPCPASTRSSPAGPSHPSPQSR